MSPQARSAYERALGSHVVELHPVLQRYFAAIPVGAVGIGEGVFEVFGSERRWLRPLFAVAKRCRVIVPGMHRRVFFRVENRTESGRQTAMRTLWLDSGEWSMIDAVSFGPSGVVDVLGSPAIVEAGFAVDVVDGGLRLTSRRVVLRLGWLRVAVPKAMRPNIALSERFDDAVNRQRVALTVDLPVLGRIYEYSGTFTYRIEG